MWVVNAKLTVKDKATALVQASFLEEYDRVRDIMRKISHRVLLLLLNTM